MYRWLYVLMYASVWDTKIVISQISTIDLLRARQSLVQAPLKRAKLSAIQVRLGRHYHYNILIDIRGKIPLAKNKRTFMPKKRIEGQMRVSTNCGGEEMDFSFQLWIIDFLDNSIHCVWMRMRLKKKKRKKERKRKQKKKANKGKWNKRRHLPIIFILF